MSVELLCGRDRIPLSFAISPYPVESHFYGYEPEVINVIEHFVEPGDFCIDAGASVGYHTCLMSKLVGEEGMVLAFEPQHQSFNLLMDTVHVLNKLNNVMCLRVALWKFDCPELELWSAKYLGYSSLYYYQACDVTLDRSEKVEGVSLDALLKGKEHPRLIKIDCEGAELEILYGAQGILERGVDCVVLELNHFLLNQINRTDKAIRAYMAALGYDMFLISLGSGNSFRNPCRVDPGISIELRGGNHINVMFSTEEKVRARWSKIDSVLDYVRREDDRGQDTLSAAE